MPDHDHKNIPVLDDIIKDETDDTAEIHEKIILSEEINVDDNTLDLFNDETANIEVDQIEPEFGAIEQFIDEAPETDSKIVEAADNEAQTDKIDIVESALIDDPLEEYPEKNITEETKSDLLLDVHRDEHSDAHSDKHNDRQPDTADPAITLDAIVDDVVTQLMPDLEQQLRLLVQQALKQKLPEEIIEQLLPDQPSAEAPAENDNG